MRNFVLLKFESNTSGGDDVTKIAEGDIGVYVKNKETGKFESTTSSDAIKGEANIVIGRKAENGGPIILPFYNHNFSFSYRAPEDKDVETAYLTFPDKAVRGTYSIIFVKKGKLFNERSNYKVSVYNIDPEAKMINLQKKLPVLKMY